VKLEDRETQINLSSLYTPTIVRRMSVVCIHFASMPIRSRHSSIKLTLPALRDVIRLSSFDSVGLTPVTHAPETRLILLSEYSVT